MKNSFRFGSDSIRSYFNNIAFPVISQPLCNISIFLSIPVGSLTVGKPHLLLRMESVMIGPTIDPISVLPVLFRHFRKLVYDQLYNLEEYKHLYIVNLVFEPCTWLRHAYCNPLMTKIAFDTVE